MRKILGLVLIVSAIVTQNSTAQSVLDQVNDPFFGESCTSIMVG